MNKEYIRSDGRTAFQLRELTVLKDYIRYAEGSVLIEMGNTKVVCTASVEENVPPFLKGSGKGWITAEYSMLPRSTHTRSIRETSRGKVGGRTHEIQRLIGRSLRAVVNLDFLGERTIWIDCDVIQADGGTRTISITGAFIAMLDALRSLNRNGIVNSIPVLDSVAAVSVGKVRGNLLLDLNYEEDSYADVDMNLVMTGKGEIVEIQGTAETVPFNKKELFDMVEIGCRGIKELSLKQKEVLEDFNK